jgi:hypothetical protein
MLYLINLSCYVTLNPAQAGMVNQAELPSTWSGLRKQIFVGLDQCIDSMLQVIANDKKIIEEISCLQHRGLAKSLDEYCQTGNRNEVIRATFNSGGYTIQSNILSAKV